MNTQIGGQGSWVVIRDIHWLEKCRLIISYSEKRKKKDVYNREKGIRRLENDYRKGSITKEKINKRGYK